MKDKQQSDKKAFGEVLGVAPGDVAVYSSDYATVDSNKIPDRHAFRHYVDGIYTGYKWQCVEFARRWLLLNRGYVFDDIAMAYDIFRLTSVRQITNGERLPLRAFPNGARQHPLPGAMLIWSEGGEFEETGHVAIVTEVMEDTIRIAEQNLDHLSWPAGQDYSRELRVAQGDNGSYWIECSYHDSRVLGWVMQVDDGLDAVPPEQPDPRLFALQRHTITQKPAHNLWLNLANPDEAAFVEAMKGHQLTTSEADQNRYFQISSSARDELKRATNELHAMFIHATEHVIENPQLLTHFNIPKELWPRIRHSFANRNNEMITGRFDFCMSEKGIKLYEYNADSASCYLECGKIQGLWAEHVGGVEGWDPGRHLWPALVDAWKNSPVKDVLHIMLDINAEENYHALYMKSAMEAAGLNCKVIHGLAELDWNAAGEVVDAEGVVIRWVWKTWAWETALEQLRKSSHEQTSQNHRPGLKDVLLRVGVMVFEPLWTVITSNKALLPLLSQLYPDNPYLLDSQFELTERLKTTGYVTKPIAGRCGANVSLFDKQLDLVGQTDGKFEQQQHIYQELWRLPEIGQQRVQICTFSVRGHYAGACLRVDASPIITTDSDILPLRVVSDTQHRSEAASNN